MNLYTKQMAYLQRSLQTAIGRGDGAAVTRIQHEMARSSGSTTLDFYSFRRAVLQRKLGELIPTKGFDVRATKAEMADLAKELGLPKSANPQNCGIAQTDGYQARMQQMVKQYPHLVNRQLPPLVPDVVCEVVGKALAVERREREKDLQRMKDEVIDAAVEVIDEMLAGRRRG